MRPAHRAAKRGARAEREASSLARDRGDSGGRAVREAPDASWTPPGFGRQVRRELGAGSAVPLGLRGDLGPLLGGAADRARLHAGTSADRLTERMGALAFTHGDDVVLSS